MKTTSIQELLSHLRISFPGDNLMKKYINEKPPLRAELFSADQMEQYGKKLAGRHQIAKQRAPNKLLKRLAANEELLLEVHGLLTDAVKAKSRIIPAGEWLLDNFYLIQEQIRTGKKHLPKGYSEDLPRLLMGPSAGLPRVYDIAIEIISHSDGRIDSKSLTNFISSYQQNTKLKLGELWAIPIMLRLALIENLRRLAAQIAMDRIYQNLADYWASEMTKTAEKDPKSLILVIADMARSGPPMVSSFVAELTRHLQGKGPSLALPLNWIEQRLSETGQTSNELVLAEIQKQAADQVSMSNSISSLRFLGTTDWQEFVESTSDVEKILREDFNGGYANMDFSTRDRYRHIVERLAKKSGLSEHEVALLVVQLAREGDQKEDPDLRSRHVGYYLIGKGIRETEKHSGYRFSLAERARWIIYRFPLFFYANSIFIISLLFGGGLFAKAYYGEHLQAGWLLLTAILSVLCASQLAVSLVNWLATLVINPLELPRMDFSRAIPDVCRTLVVVPTMLTDLNEIEKMTETLEVHFLANKDTHLHFGLLTDFADAPTEHLPEDEILLHAASRQIEELNNKYKSERKDIFFLFHRPRKWNQPDKMWMGYERKRGKLTELNALLRGQDKDFFSALIGDQSILPKIKYVITLDTDTQLPRDSAWKIVATMAHPLNQPRYHEKKKRVTEGYGILQPRVAMSLPSADSSLFARVHGNVEGIDPYTRATSDVYQDLFAEGSFIGKGIYDVDIFSKVLDNRFPENRILSHDLLEGCYTRCGLLSDVQLYEEYPLHYNTDVKRRHRWIRGDWQIGAWLLPLVPGAGGRWERNHLSALSRWKIFDNLRRSLVPASLLFLLLSGWIILHAAWFWTISVIAMILLPQLVATAGNLLRKPKDISTAQHFRDSLSEATGNFLQTIFTIICLPYEAYYTLDAILRTNWRMIISRKKLLEWNPSHQKPNKRAKTLVATYSLMWFAPITGIGMLVYITVSSPISLVTGIPVLFLWIAAPGIAWWVSLSKPLSKTVLKPEQAVFLRKLARKIWGFFEIFVGEEDNWLPPDNFQEHPVERIAHRTSPTNIGLSLLSNLSAWDFGYITTGQLIERTGNTLGTLQKLERFHGHLFNWYDTKTLHPLPPRYISTVDSGNLAGHLITLYNGLRNAAGRKIITRSFFEGLGDTLDLLQDELSGEFDLAPLRLQLEQAGNDSSLSLFDERNRIEILQKESSSLILQLDSQKETEAYYWSRNLLSQCSQMIKEINELVPAPLLVPMPEKFKDFSYFTDIPTLRELSVLKETLADRLLEKSGNENTEAENNWLDVIESCSEKTGFFAREKLAALENLAAMCLAFADIDYEFLFDRGQKLLTIGYNVEDHRKDPGSYDLLASEARLGTFVGIAQGKLPQESWFALGRQLTNRSGTPVLLSWSGSMFEYLMPLLVMPDYDNTLLNHTYKAMVDIQINYGNQREIPWGISESGFNMVDASLNYQYRAFGVPGLGFKRGLAEDLVIAPYASALALMVAPEEACKNLELLTARGFGGRYGLYEAIDYTPSRLPRGQSSVTIRSFMVHHQGMSLLSLAYLLLDRPMQKRFESEPQFQATLLLLQEKVPKSIAYYSPSADIEESSVSAPESEMQVINTPHTPLPSVQLLSNGRYHVMVTNSGAGSSRWKDLAVTRWREDSTCDNWGTFCYIRDLETGNFWSSGYQPSLRPARNYEVVFSQGRAEFRRHDDLIETYTEIVVSPEDDIEIRRLHITNRSKKSRALDITSFAEVVLTSAASDAAHPAFSNLFVQTQILESKHAILCTRRPRSSEEQCPWMFHLMNIQGVAKENISYETDRMKFVGRKNSVINPRVMSESGQLSGSDGSVLDPIVAIRYRINIEPNETAIVDMVTGIAESREICLSLVEKYQDRHLTDRVFELSWTHSQVVLRQINATESDAQLYSRMAASVIFSNPALRADPALLVKNQRGQSGLWSYSISGDLPIVLLQIEDPANIGLVKQLVQAHAYWRLKGLAVDLVIWNEDHGGYRQLLQNQLLGLISAGVDSDISDRPGGIFIRSADQISEEDRILFQAVARIVVSDLKGSLAYQINKRIIVKPSIPNLSPKTTFAPINSPLTVLSDLTFFNGYGGFSGNGKEYVIITQGNKATPTPWVNVLANQQFGTVISESGQAYTWSENAHEFRLSPWNNDSVSDPSGEAFYLRDEDSGYFWSPTPLPACGKSVYQTIHGFGYSRFECKEDGIYSEMTVFVDPVCTIKFIIIKIRNESGRPRRLSATGYIEWVLGELKNKSAAHIISRVHVESGAILATNTYNTEFCEKVCFFQVNDPSRTFTADRTEFIGRNGTLQKPDALSRTHLSGKSGAALDPCTALQTCFDLTDGQDHEVIFSLGTGRNYSDAIDLLTRYRNMESIHSSFKENTDFWERTLGSLRVESADPSLDLLTNGWLMYQTLACRFWARSGFYQSGGAFGFRDQLQDSMTILYTHPALAREHILLCASRQFKEGDVQHWWHPPLGKGVRTRCSDDYLWLPFVTCKYISQTGDREILDEKSHYLEARLLTPGEESVYDLPTRSPLAETLYEHCVRSIKHGLQFGMHGLPLIGSGDWNDGMDKVGKSGKGESVWLAFFLYKVLIEFSAISRDRKDQSFSNLCLDEAAKLKSNIAISGWDGNWYRRAYYDDGNTIGSAGDSECQIDSIAQSWSVLSGAGDPELSSKAIHMADIHLVNKEASLIQLLTPPFDKSESNPGYIKGYVPGVRENGGQYTHAAIWLVMAFAAAGKYERAWELFSLINPIHHGSTGEETAVYGSEPYVVAADVYAVSGFTGKGGWTWYTGSAGWMYQLIIEYLLGVKIQGNRISFSAGSGPLGKPFVFHYRFESSLYHIAVAHPGIEPETRIVTDGITREGRELILADDGLEHQVKVAVGSYNPGLG